MASRSGRPSAAEPVPCGRNAHVIGKAVKINNLQTDAVHGDLGRHNCAVQKPLNYRSLWMSSSRSAHEGSRCVQRSALSCTLCVQRSALSRTWTSAHLARRGTEASSKGPIERGETIEAPGIGDVGDGTIPAQRTCEGRTTFLKPLGLDMLRKTYSSGLEEKMQLADGNLDGGGCLRGCQPGVSQMFRYVIFRLLQLGGPDSILLRARCAPASQREKTTEVVDDRWLLRMAECVDGFVQRAKIASDNGAKTFRSGEVDRERAPVVRKMRLDQAPWKKPSAIVMRAPRLIRERNGWIQK